MDESERNRFTNASRFVWGGSIVSLFIKNKKSPLAACIPRLLPPAKPVFLSLRITFIWGNIDESSDASSLLDALSTTITSSW